MLQIIHGSIVLFSFTYLYWDCLQTLIIIEYAETIISLLFLLISFSIGVFIDFIADNLETIIVKFVIKPPVFYLLTKDQWWGITLAHKDFILQDLCKIAAKHDEKQGTLKIKTARYKTQFEGRDNRTINYILQVAKNKAFRKCKDYQKDQIESFFVLYIFSRNLSLSLLISLVLFNWSHFLLSAILLSSALLSLLSAYRYFLYYTRIMLGTIF